MEQERSGSVAAGAPSNGEATVHAGLYTYRVWWNEHDQVHLAECKELRLASVHGDSPEHALHTAIEAVAVALATGDSTLEVTLDEMMQTERPYSGQHVASRQGISVERVLAIAQEHDLGVFRGPDRFFSASELVQLRRAVSPADSESQE